MSRESDGAPGVRVAITAEQLLRPNSGGIGTYTEQLIRAYGRAFGAPVVLSNRAPHHNPSDMGFGGQHLSTSFPHRIGGRLWERGILTLPRRLRGLDVVHATSFHFPSMRRRGSTRPGPRLSVFVHDLAWKRHPEFFTERGRAFHDRGLDRARSQATWLLVPSCRTAQDLIEIDVPRERIVVVGEGADHLPPPSVERSVPKKPYLLTVSTIEPRKNLANLLRAYEKAKRGSGTAFPDLVVVGATGWTGTEHDGVLPNVDGARFAGHVSPQALADLYADAIGFAYVPHLEGFGLPPLEAMSAGVPVIASSAVPSITESFVCPALVVAADDVEAIANEIGRLLEDARLRAELVIRGTHHVADFTWDAVARRHHDVWSNHPTNHQPTSLP